MRFYVFQLRLLTFIHYFIFIDIQVNYYGKISGSRRTFIEKENLYEMQCAQFHSRDTLQKM